MSFKIKKALRKAQSKVKEAANKTPVGKAAYKIAEASLNPLAMVRNPLDNPLINPLAVMGDNPISDAAKRVGLAKCPVCGK